MLNQLMNGGISAPRTGSPQAIASSNAIPNVSASEAKTKRSKGPARPRSGLLAAEPHDRSSPFAATSAWQADFSCASPSPPARSWT